MNKTHQCIMDKQYNLISRKSNCVYLYFCAFCLFLDTLNVVWHLFGINLDCNSLVFRHVIFACYLCQDNDHHCVAFSVLLYLV